MACRRAYRVKNTIREFEKIPDSVKTPTVAKKESARLLFGVDAAFAMDDHLQNNVDLFEWVVKNKIYPNFCGRNINGENCLTKEEIKFIRSKGCKIAAIYLSDERKEKEETGVLLARKIGVRALELGIPEGTAIFLAIDEKEPLTRDFLRGFAKALMVEGFIPGFKANTDAAFWFDKAFSRGIQSDKNLFSKCLIWATAPTVKEYDAITTSHLIHPDNWMPYAPSGISRSEIAVWQYGKKCHPIEDDDEKTTAFDLDLVRNEQVIIDAMF